MGVTQDMATHGHGGKGKTELALEYGWQAVEGGKYPGGVFVVREDARFIFQKIADLALFLGLMPLQRPEDTAHLVRQTLEHGAPSLLILDNVDDPDQWRETLESGFLPAGVCRRLITTRCPRLRQAEMYPLDRLPTDDGVRLLAKFRPDAADAAHRHAVEAIVEWFDGLAVGLVVLGAFLKLNRTLDWEQCAAKLDEKGLGAVQAIEEFVDRKQARPDLYEKRVAAIFDDWADL